MFAFLQFQFFLSVPIITIVIIQPHFAEDELSATHGDVIYSTVFFRHGDRAPSNEYLTRDESYWLNYWPQGKGNLSQFGKYQEYDLGRWFRYRYNSLVMTEIQTKQNAEDWLKMDSSNVDRNIKSAKFFLYGFFYPNHEVELEDMLTVPPPVEIKTNKMIGFYKIDCKRYLSEKETINNYPEWQSFYINYRHTFQYMKNKLKVGSPQQNDIVKAVEEAYSLYDTFFIEEQTGLRLQKWAKAIYPEPIKTIAMVHFSFIVYNDVMKKLRSGPLIEEVVDNMESKIDGESNAPTFHFYSGHDFTLSSLLVSLGVFDNNPPPTGSALLFELRKRGNDYIVTVSYRLIMNSEPHLLQIPGCGSGYFCTFENFKQLMAHLIPNNWEELCNAVDTDSD